MTLRGFPSGSAVKNLTTNAGDAGLVPGLGRSPGVGNGNLMDREAWWAMVHGLAKSQTGPSH